MKRVGLFIGIDNYKNGISKLQYAVNDAKSLSFAFNKAGFTSELMQNEECSCDNILTKMQEVTAGLNSGDIFLFYFSGHGREVNGSHYLVGATGHASSSLYTVGSVQLAALIEFTNRIPGLNRFFILDCCRSNLLADRAGTFVCSNARDLALESAVAPDTDQSIIPPLILSSCSTGEQAFEDPVSKHGFFTRVLLDVVGDREIRSFRKFCEGLKISGTPAPQHVSWNGNMENWEKILLLNFWEDAPAEEEPRVQVHVQSVSLDPSEVARYQSEALYLKVQELMEKLPDSVAERLRPDFDAAARAWENGDYPAALHLLQLTRDAIEKVRSEAQKKKEKVSPPPAGAAQTVTGSGLSLSADGTLLIAAPSTTATCVVPEGVTAIGEGAFQNCETLREIRLPEGIVEIRANAFKDCRSLTSCRLPQSLKFIGESAFDGCISLSRISLPAGISEIGDRAFANCRKFRVLFIPGSVNSVGNDIAKGCSHLFWCHLPKHLRWKKWQIIGVHWFVYQFRGCLVFILFWILLNIGLCILVGILDSLFQ